MDGAIEGVGEAGVKHFHEIGVCYVGAGFVDYFFDGFAFEESVVFWGSEV